MNVDVFIFGKPLFAIKIIMFHVQYLYKNIGVLAVVQENPSLFCNVEDYFFNILNESPPLCYFTGNEILLKLALSGIR